MPTAQQNAELDRLYGITPDMSNEQREAIYNSVDPATQQQYYTQATGGDQALGQAYSRQMEQSGDPNNSRSGQVVAYPGDEVYWGGGSDPFQYADMFSGIAQSRMNAAGAGQDYALGEMERTRGPQAWENQELSDREAFTRGYDQQGALELAREAALGQAPSEAAYMMQQGLDRATAGQTSMAGSARGAAGIAQAQSNAAANVANMQGQAWTEAGRLRAQEMAQARGLYGGLAGQMREQDLQRLGMGNSMAEFNAGLNDQYKIGMAGSAAQLGNQGFQWYQGAMQPYDQVGKYQSDYQGRRSDTYMHAQDVARGIDVRNQDRADEWRDRILNASATTATAIGQGTS